jgi:hypothetical protein
LTTTSGSKRFMPALTESSKIVAHETLPQASVPQPDVITAPAGDETGTESDGRSNKAALRNNGNSPNYVATSRVS